MPELSAIGAVSPITSGLLLSVSGPPAAPVSGSGFADTLASGLRDVNDKVGRADTLIQAFAQGDSIPVHRVTLALEEARLAVELAVEVRARLIETYRDFVNMQI